jgi:flagellar hook-basal body complex protein FliE
MISAISGVRPLGGAGIAPNVGPAASAAAGGDFTKVLADVATSAVDTLKTGEATAISGINGGKSVQQVVDAVMNAEQALQTAIAVRDKLISAYQEISRMAI